MVTTLCLSGAVIRKCGLNADTTLLTDTILSGYINQAEGEICVNARYDFVALSGSTCAIGKEFLKDVCSSMAAMNVINQQMAGYTSRTESQVMLDVNWTTAREGLNLLRDNNYVKFIVGGVSNTW